MSPKDKETTLNVLREHLPNIKYLEHKPGAHAWLLQALNDIEALSREPVDFKLCKGGQFTVNGVAVPRSGKGLMLAWLTLAGIKYRLGALRPELVFKGRRWSASTKQALDRAEEAVKPISPDLANAIRDMGVCRGELVMKGNPQVRVRCTLDDTLLEAARRLA